MAQNSRKIAASIIAISLSYLLATPAAAASTPSPTSTPSAGEKITEHCVIKISTGKKDCFPTFKEAIKKASGGSIDTAALTKSAKSSEDEKKLLLDQIRTTYGPGANLKINDGGKTFKKIPTITQPTTKALKSGTDTVMLIVWIDANQLGTSLTFSDDGPDGCWHATGDTIWPVPYIGNDWNDRISSYDTFANCAVKLYQHRDYGGAMIGGNWSNNLGIMNDQVSSLKLW